jgi:WD40 repeat protein
MRNQVLLAAPGAHATALDEAVRVSASCLGFSPSPGTYCAIGNRSGSVQIFDFTTVKTEVSCLPSWLAVCMRACSLLDVGGDTERARAELSQVEVLPSPSRDTVQDAYLSGSVCESEVECVSWHRDGLQLLVGYKLSRGASTLGTGDGSTHATKRVKRVAKDEGYLVLWDLSTIRPLWCHRFASSCACVRAWVGGGGG